MLAGLDGHAQVERGPDGKQYLGYSEAGSLTEIPDTLRWTFSWTAPDEDDGVVVAHVAANASNDDASEFGDRIYTRAVRSWASLPPAGRQVLQ